jgi:plastocyanin
MRPRTFTLNEETVMNTKRGTWLVVILLTMSLAALASCYSSGNGYPTAPGAGGGGGSRELNSGDFGPGATFEHTFATAGTFNYHCIHHAPMTGSVVVSAAATEMLVNVSIVSSTAGFPAASVKPGGRVIWTNNTNMIHTVTSN